MKSKTSEMIKSMKGWNGGGKISYEAPKGLFGRIIQVDSGSVHIDGGELDVEFSIPFDDDTEANEAEIILYNLSGNTIAQLSYDQVLTVTAGYKGDTGVIFSGYISKVKTSYVGVDKKTVVYAIDSMRLKERTIKSIAYSAGVKASYILGDLLGRIGLPVAVFQVRRDHTYKDKVNVTGELMGNIKKFAQVCGVSAYILGGKAYVRHIKDGDNIHFTVGEETGLVGSPEEFEEEIQAEDFRDIIKGYQVTMLLQHRITTAVVIDLSSREVSGSFRVRSGRHSYNGTEFYTEFTCI